LLFKVISPRALKMAARDLAILVVLAGAGELALRLLAPAYGHKIFDNLYTGSYPIGVNADGYRGPAEPPQKPAGQLRVLALGDSETFGTGVPADRTWPAQLGEELALRRPGNVAVINGGLEGFGLRDIAQAWRDKWRAYTPDVVVVGATASMIALEVARPEILTFDQAVHQHGAAPSGVQRLKLSALRAYHSLYLVGFISVTAQRVLYWCGLLDHRLNPHMPFGHMLAYGWSQGDLPQGLARDAWSRFAADYKTFAAEVEAAGARLVVAWLPPRFDLSDSWRDNEKNIQKERFTLDPAHEVETIVGGSSARFVNLLPALRDARAAAAAEHRDAPLYIHFDDVHLDEEGGHVAARAIAEAMGAGQ